MYSKYKNGSKNQTQSHFLEHLFIHFIFLWYTLHCCGLLFYSIFGLCYVYAKVCDTKIDIIAGNVPGFKQ